jgi:hypothetical protein
LIIALRPAGIAGLSLIIFPISILLSLIIIKFFDERQHVPSLKEVLGGTLEGRVFRTREDLDHLLIIEFRSVNSGPGFARLDFLADRLFVILVVGGTLSSRGPFTAA